jgi:uncharacterized protein (TIGR02598 family)
LVEVVLSIGIVAVALMGLLGMLLYGHKQSRCVVDDSAVGSFANDLLAEMRTANWNTLASVERTIDREGRDPSQTDYAGDHYRALITVQSFTGVPATSYSNYLKRVELRIVWPSPSAAFAAPNTNYYHVLVPKMDFP